MDSFINVDIVILGKTVSGTYAAHCIKEKLGNSVSLLLIDQNSKAIKNEDVVNDSINEFSKMDYQSRNSIEDKYLEEFNKFIGLKKVESSRIKSNQSRNTVDCIFDRYCTFEEFIKINKLKQWFQQLDSFRNLCYQLDNITMEEHIKRYVSTAESRIVAEQLVQDICDLKPSQISLLCFLWIKNSHKLEMCRFDMDFNGIQLNIVEISGSKHNIVLKSENCVKLHCKILIMALHPFYIKNIKFHDNLKDGILNLIQDMHYNSIRKIMITYPTTFWNINSEIDHNIIIPGKFIRKVKRGYDIQIAKSDLKIVLKLVVCLKLDYMDYNEENIKERVLEELSKYFGKDAYEYLDYYEEPSMSFAVPQIGHFEEFITLMNNSKGGYIIWNALDFNNNSELQTSLKDGYIASLYAIAQIRPQALNFEDVKLITK